MKTVLAIVIVLTAYWRIKEYRKRPYIYYYFSLVLLIMYIFAESLHNNCFGG